MNQLQNAAKSKVLVRAATIINKHFSEAIQDKESEIEAINSSILEAQKALHLLRYGSVTQTYASVTDVVISFYFTFTLSGTDKLIILNIYPVL